MSRKVILLCGLAATTVSSATYFAYRTRWKGQKEDASEQAVEISTGIPVEHAAQTPDPSDGLEMPVSIDERDLTSDPDSDIESDEEVIE